VTVTLNEIVLEAAMRCGAAFSSTCSSAGTTTTLVDSTARDQGTDANFAAGGWIYRPDAATAADKVRRITNEGFDPETGTWTVTRAWSDAPDNAEEYQVYSILPPIEQTGLPESWRRLVNRGLNATWFQDEVVVGSGDGSLGRRFTLTSETGWTPNVQQIKKVVYRTIDTDGITFDQDQSKNGRYWRIDFSSGDAVLVVGFPPTSDQDVVVTVLRTYPTLSADDDDTNCPLDLIALRTRYELYRYLDATPQSRGQYAAEAALALSDWQAEYRQHRPSGGVIFA
jgi:hypothetical protein